MTNCIFICCVFRFAMLMLSLLSLFSLLLLFLLLLLLLALLTMFMEALITARMKPTNPIEESWEKKSHFFISNDRVREETATTKMKT